MATFDTVLITAAPAAAGSTVVFQETFPGADNTAWPLDWTITAAGGAATSGATVLTGQGRHTLPSTGGYPSIGAVRNGVSIADFNATLDTGGQFDSSSGLLAEHYREMLWRHDLTDPARGLADAYGVSITPDRTSPTTEPWNCKFWRRRGGQQITLANYRSIAASHRDIRVRAVVEGQRTRLKFWPTGSTEPSTWQIDYTDDSTEAILTAGRIALTSFAGNAAGASATYVTYDNMLVEAVVPAPTVSATVDPTTIWNDPIALVATATDQTSFAWTVTERPAGSTATVADPSALSTTFTPDKAGRYAFRASANNYAGSATSDHTVDVYAQMWQRTATGKVPVAIYSRTV